MFEVRVPPILEPFVGIPRVAIVLGSGFGGLVDAVRDANRVPYSKIEGAPQAPHAVAGHENALVFGTAADVPVCVFAGRVHRYQGVSALDAAYPARLAAALGCTILIVTNAAGGVSTRLNVGDVVLISDHVNLTGDSPLVGWPGPPGGVPFVPMANAYDSELRLMARDVAGSQGMTLTDGVYAGLLGPAFETPAEVRYLRSIGADVVGMSTVPEVIAARALGLKVLGFSLVTNAAAGEGLSHEEVLEAGASAQVALAELLVGILARL